MKFAYLLCEIYTLCEKLYSVQKYTLCTIHYACKIALCAWNNNPYLSVKLHLCLGSYWCVKLHIGCQITHCVSTHTPWVKTAHLLWNSTSCAILKHIFFFMCPMENFTLDWICLHNHQLWWLWQIWTMAIWSDGQMSQIHKKPLANCANSPANTCIFGHKLDK